jgi:hypothetical protein
VATNDCEGDMCLVQYTRILRGSARILWVSSNPDIPDENSGHSGNQNKLNLNLYDGAHDDMICTQISLGMLHRACRPGPS